MNIKIKKLACISGVILSYLLLFFFGQGPFLTPNHTAADIQLSAGKSTTAETKIHVKGINQPHEAKLNDIVRIPGYGIHDLKTLK